MVSMLEAFRLVCQAMGATDFQQLAPHRWQMRVQGYQPEANAPLYRLAWQWDEAEQTLYCLYGELHRDEIPDVIGAQVCNEINSRSGVGYLYWDTDIHAAIITAAMHIARPEQITQEAFGDLAHEGYKVVKVLDETAHRAQTAQKNTQLRQLRLN